MANPTRPNMAPADELKRLRAREAALREQVLGKALEGREIESGQDWRVEVIEQRRRTLDRAACRPRSRRPPPLEGDDQPRRQDRLGRAPAPAKPGR